MKKTLITIIVLVLSLGAWIFVDRYNHIQVFSEYEGKTVLDIYDSTWVEPIKGRWLNLEDECKVYNNFIYVDDFNPISRTWKESYSMYTIWIYYDDSGQPLPLTVTESDIYFTPNFMPDYDYKYYDEIDGIKVYYEKIDSSLYLKLESKTKIITFNISIYHQDRLEGFVEKAIEVLNDQ